MQTYQLTFIPLAFSLGLGLFSAACTRPDAPSPVTDVVTNVTASDGSVASRQSGAPPPSTSSGPTISAQRVGTVTSGGTDIVQVHASSPIQTVYASIEGRDGFYQLPLRGATTDITINSSLGDQLPSSYMASFRAASPAGVVGAVATLNSVTQSQTAPTIAITPASLNFPPTKVGTTSNAVAVVTLTSFGTMPIQLSTAVTSNSTEFPRTNTTCAFPGTLSAGASCSITIQFKPSATGTRTAQLTVTTSNAGSGILLLSGTGT